MNRFLPVVCVISMALAACIQSDSDVSGVYVEQTGSELVLIQIVKSEDGNVTGRGELVKFVNGQLDMQSFSLTGTADGSQISLKSNVFLGLGPSFSGEVKSNTLTLVGVEGQSVLKRSSLEQFTKQKNELVSATQVVAVTDQNLKAGEQQRKFLADLAEEGLNIEIKVPQAYTVLEQKTDAILANTRSRYDGIQGNISKLKAEWLITPADDKGSVEGDIQSLKGDLLALEGDYVANLIDLRMAYDQLQAGLNGFKEKCDKAISMSYTPVPSQCGKSGEWIMQYDNHRAATKVKVDAANAAMFVKR